MYRLLVLLTRSIGPGLAPPSPEGSSMPGPAAIDEASVGTGIEPQAGVMTEPAVEGEPGGAAVETEPGLPSARGRHPILGALVPAILVGGGWFVGWQINGPSGGINGALLTGIIAGAVFGAVGAGTIEAAVRSSVIWAVVGAAGGLIGLFQRAPSADEWPMLGAVALGVALIGGTVGGLVIGFAIAAIGKAAQRIRQRAGTAGAAPAGQGGAPPA